MKFRTWRVEFRTGIFEIEGNEKVILNQKKFKTYFEVLRNCENWLLTRIRTHHNAKKFTQIAQIIFGKPDLLFVDG